MEKIVNFVLYAVGLGMGIASVVLTALNSVETRTILILLGIGMFCIGVAGINAHDEK